MNTKKLLIIYPSTFIWKDNRQVVMYNSQSHMLYYFLCNEITEYYCDHLLDMTNLYVIEIEESHITNGNLIDWLHNIEQLKMGYVDEIQETKTFIVSFPPLLNLQSDIDRIEAAEDRDVGEYAAQNWNEFSIYLGGESKFPNLHKQIPYPVDDSSILPFYDLQAFLSSSDNSYLNTINIIGNPFSYPYKAELMDLLYSIPVKKNFYLTASTACRFIKEIQQIDLPNYELYIYYEQEEASIHHILTEKQIPFHWIYLISSEKQYEDLEKLETKYGNEYVEVHPIYTGDNLPFFEENVYLAEEDILQSNYDKQDIFAHQVMNTNFWGRLSVLPDGKVYSNLNHPPLGTLKDRVYDLIVDEMKSKRAWRWIRDEVSPCKD